MWNIKALALTVLKLFKASLKFSEKWVKLQAQGHSVKNNGTHRKVLSQGILMWNIKTLALTVQKLLARLKFQTGRTEWQNYRMTDRTKTICPPPIFDLGGINISDLINQQELSPLYRVFERKMIIKNKIFCCSWKLLMPLFKEYD